MLKSTEYKELKKIQDKIGDLSTEALRLGGEEALDQVEIALGVALRHTARISAGMLFFTSTIQREMLDSLERAERVLNEIRSAKQGEGHG